MTVQNDPRKTPSTDDVLDNGWVIGLFSISGLAVTVFSDLPSLRLFGWLSAFAMLAALTADLLILRPTAMFLSSLVRRLRPSRTASDAAE